MGEEEKSSPAVRSLDPAKFMSVAPGRCAVRSLRPMADDAAGDDVLEDADDARMTMAEAFADDGVVAEFRSVLGHGTKTIMVCLTTWLRVIHHLSPGCFLCHKQHHLVRISD